jgi:oligopeptidase B
MTPPDPQPPVPPVAARHPHPATIHGETRQDDYFWLREKGDPAVTAHLEAENQYAAAVMAPTQPLQAKLYQEMLGRIQETDLGVPYLYRGWFYYSRTEAGKQYPIYCRKRGTLDAPEEITIDLNVLAAGESFMGLGIYEVSDDGRWLAYALDTTGFRQYTLHVRDLESGSNGPERIARVTSAAWAADSATLFYIVEDESTKRSDRLFRHRLGGAGGPEADALIQNEPDERFNLGVYRSRSGAFLFSSAGSHTASEVRALPADTPSGDFRLIAAREDEHEYSVDHRGELFYIRTNRSGRNFELATAPAGRPEREHWRTLVPHRPEVMLEGVDLFSGHAVLSERERGLPRLRILDLGSGDAHTVEFPEPAYHLQPAANAEFDTPWFRFSYQSLKTPQSVYDYQMKTRERTLLKRIAVLGGYDPEQFVTERIEARGDDGAAIPISLIYRKGMRQDGGNPLLLYGYGAYGIVVPAGFSSSRVSLLDRGMVYAIAHVRGGGELGKPWHDAGRMLHKRNSFADLIAAARHLAAAGYADPRRLAIEGASAGGLLVCAAANLNPELFRAVIARVPFVDVINSMLDEKLPLTVGEFEEWGNPKIQAQYDYMKNYCPYSNLAAVAHPAMLIKTSFNDSQVMYWEPAKYVAKLRTLNRGDLPVLLKCNMAGGHGGASGRYDQLHDLAHDYAFLLTQLGVENAVGGEKS